MTTIERPTTTNMCSDLMCGGTGLTKCRPCNGHGLLSPKGGTYRTDRTAFRRNNDGASFPPHAVQHAECNGTGMVECGCVPLDDEMRVSLAGTFDAIEVRRYSTAKGALVTVGAIKPEPVQRTAKPQNLDKVTAKPAPRKPAAKAKATRARDPKTGHFLPKAEPVDRSMDDLDWDAIEAAQTKAQALLPKLTQREHELIKTQLNGVVMVGYTDADRRMHARLSRLGLLAEHQRKSGAVPVRDLAIYVRMALVGSSLVRPAHLRTV